MQGHNAHSIIGRDTHPQQVPNVGVHQFYAVPPEPRTKKFKRVHRIILDSSHMFEGDAALGKFAVNLPTNIKPEDCQLFVESFIMKNSTANAICDTEYYHLHLNELFQPLTYYSGTLGSTNIIATLKGREFFTYPTFESCGIPLTDPNFFNNKVLSFEISSENEDVVNAIDSDWILTLVIYEET
jgi:hypothetical protein